MSREVGMVDLDRYCAHDCGRHTVVWWALIPDHDDAPGLDWYVCAVHSDATRDTLLDKGWVMMADERETVTVEPIATEVAP